MSRRRYISTDISTDIKTAELAEHGTLPLLLYTWAIPHMDDWGRMTGDARQFKLLVCPALDISSREVDEALNHITSVGLWERYDLDGKQVISIDEDNWFKHQSYINKGKRGDDSGSNYPKSPKNAEERRESPQKAASFSPSPSLSPSPSKESSSSSMIGNNPFSLYQKQGFGNIDETTAIFVGDTIDTYGEDWTRRAMVEAVKHNKKVWSYVEGILKRWKATGHAEPWTIEKEEPKPQQRFNGYGRPQSPRMEVVKDTGPTPAITSEEREKMRELARKLKEESA